MKRVFLSLGFLLLISCLSLMAPNPASASPDEVKWSRVNIPTEGKGGGWVLANDANTRHLTLAHDGTLYAYANPAGTSYTLFKSNDHGKSWSYTTKVSDTIIAIATAPDDADVIYYATSSTIYKSDDGAASFSELPAPGGAGSNNIAITSIAVARQDDGYILATATRDSDNAEYGGVYLLDESELIPRWQDSNLSGFDAYKVAFSPNYAADYQLATVVTDESDTLVTSKVSDGGWGANIANATLDVAVAVSADIAFPDGYDALSDDQSLFIAIDSGSDNGDGYRIELAPAPGDSSATDLDIGDDITSIAVSGSGSSAKLLAGAADSAQVYFSTDGGDSWAESAKPPTGGSQTFVLLDSNTAYAATSGSESALSISEDFTHWNQLSLIDTEITTIIDRAPYPPYGQDGDTEIESDNLFLLTSGGGEHSLWRSSDEGASWQRVFSSALPNVDSLKLVELPPRYDRGSQVVFLAGVYDGNPAIWKSKDNGQGFTHRLTHDPYSSDPFPIDVWAVVDSSTLFIGSYDDSDEYGLVYYTTNSGLNYAAGNIVGKYPLTSLILSPDYEPDETMLASNTNGWVYWSSDNGITFRPLPITATRRPLTSSITVAFDPEFSSNDTVYILNEAGDKPRDVKKGIYRFVINQSTEWEYVMPITTPTLVGPDPYFSVKVDPATDRVDQVVFAWKRPAEEVDKYELWIAYDSAFDQMVEEITIDETEATVRVIASPGADIPLVFTPGSTYFWKVRVASDYTFKCPWSDTRQFTIETVKAPSTVVIQEPAPPPKITIETPPAPQIEMAPWVVEIIPQEPALTPPLWVIAAIGSVLVIALIFQISISYRQRVPRIYSPEDDATEVAIKPLFQWRAVKNAEGYELLVATDPSLAEPRIAKTGAYALPGTTWKCDVSLNANTTYYWKVRAIGAKTKSVWSHISHFTTRPLTTTSPPGHLR